MESLTEKDKKITKLMDDKDKRLQNINDMNTNIQCSEIKLRKYEEDIARYGGIASKMEVMRNDNKQLNENVSELRQKCMDNEMKYESAAMKHAQVSEKNVSNQETISILKHEIENANERNNILEKNFDKIMIRLNTIEKVNCTEKKDDDISDIDTSNNTQQPSVILFHDSLCKSINPTILSNEKVTMKKIWAPTLADVQKEITEISRSNVIVLEPLTRSLSTLSTEDIIKQTIDTIEMCLEKTDKVVLSSVITRDDDKVIDATAELVNANLKFRYLGNSNVLVCNNDNLRDRKFRVGDGIHLTDYGTSVFANNLKYKIAEALDIAVIKKRRIDSKVRNYKYSGYQRNDRYADRNLFNERYER